MAKVVILRFSALGDVAMTIPVIYSVAKANPVDSFTVVTQPFLVPLFINKPDNVEMLSIDTKGSEKSLRGLLRFAFRLAGRRFDMVLDLHNVIRSRLIDMILRWRGTHVYMMDKIRKARKQLTKKPPKAIAPLRTTVERYTEVFHSAGFSFEDTFTSLFEDNLGDNNILQAMLDNASFESVFNMEKKGRWIGIAPFARHPGKVYPVDEMEKVVGELIKQPDTTLFFFGGGEYEEAVLSQWEFQWPNTNCIAGRFTLFEELALMSRMDLLVCMDSANMHFASLVGTKVVSIWGATHPFAGFYGYRQDPQNAVQIDLPCRPCSVYGNKPCHRDDYACMKQITPEQIIDKINLALEQA
ncbi:MAG: glycosyltransferase family 9 protein [Tannerella sp.]|jgi:ADP-heptose:LPS heptosyltransferase|nr:glycosyltransferase family 9 protein [Tannerella sp.]